MLTDWGSKSVIYVMARRWGVDLGSAAVLLGGSGSGGGWRRIWGDGAWAGSEDLVVANAVLKGELVRLRDECSDCLNLLLEHLAILSEGQARLERGVHGQVVHGVERLVDLGRDEGHVITIEEIQAQLAHQAVQHTLPAIEHHEELLQTLHGLEEGREVCDGSGLAAQEEGQVQTGILEEVGRVELQEDCRELGLLRLVLEEIEAADGAHVGVGRACDVLFLTVDLVSPPHQELRSIHADHQGLVTCHSGEAILFHEEAESHSSQGGALTLLVAETTTPYILIMTMSVLVVTIPVLV